MMSLTIGGRLGGDPTLGNANGTPVLNMSVAVDGWDPKAREKVTTWVRVAFFGTRAEKLGEFLTKGSSVMCTGEARLSEYKGKQYLELTASAVTMMGAKPSGDVPSREREQPKRQSRAEPEEPPF
jgi:single-stranded DNA-binding protein